VKVLYSFDVLGSRQYLVSLSVACDVFLLILSFSMAIGKNGRWKPAYLFLFVVWFLQQGREIRNWGASFPLHGEMICCFCHIWFWFRYDWRSTYLSSNTMSTYSMLPFDMQDPLLRQLASCFGHDKVDLLSRCSCTMYAMWSALGATFVNICTPAYGRLMKLSSSDIRLSRTSLHCAIEMNGRA
jgi:hypothetical protein